MASKKTYQNTHTHTHNSSLKVDYDVPPNVQKLANKVIGFLEKKYGYDDLAKKYNKKEKFVNLNHLKDAIRHSKGTDPRTITQGFEDLKGKVIKENGGLGAMSFDFAPFGGEKEELKKVQNPSLKQPKLQPKEDRQVQYEKDFEDLIKGLPREK
jgi:hypothetical protein